MRMNLASVAALVEYLREELHSVDNNPIDIVICLGSSCFARGNAENLRDLKAYLERNNIGVNFRACGTLCVRNCPSGPTIAINGNKYGYVKPGTAIALLERELRRRNKGC